MPYLFTSDALVFKPFNETPRRFNQNRSSSFFKVQPGKRREYRPLTRHMQPYVTIKTIREKPPHNRGAFCCACASRILFGACCVIFSARFAGFQRGDWHLFVIFFGEGCKRMTSLPIFLTLWILVVFAGSSDEDISMFKVRTKREKSPKTWSLRFGLLKIKMCRWLMANLEG